MAPIALENLAAGLFIGSLPNLGEYLVSSGWQKKEGPFD